MCVCKLLVLKEVVGAKGFEPSTSWSRTTNNKSHIRFNWRRLRDQDHYSPLAYLYPSCTHTSGRTQMRDRKDAKLF
jgi:hypothetical protein